MNEHRTNSLPWGNHPGNEPKDGFTFNWLNLFLGAAICYMMTNGAITDDWTFYLYLGIAVVIHELGHVIMGKSFGCSIKEMQVFLLPFVSYKPKHLSDGNSWRSIKWSLGTIPLGGVTMFRSRQSIYEGYSGNVSPFIEDKAAWQRMLISAAGVLFNIATFLILYVALPFVSAEWQDIFRPLAGISLLLAVLNILPVYPLDGGAIVFAIYEMITGRKPSPAVTKACGWIGFVFIVLFFWVFPEWLGGIIDAVLKLFF